MRCKWCHADKRHAARPIAERLAGVEPLGASSVWTHIIEAGKTSCAQELTVELDHKEALRNHQAEQSKRAQSRLHWIIAGLVLVLAVSMAGTFASSIVAVESAKDTVISADGAFVDKNTGVPVSTENPHFTTMAAGEVQGLLQGEVDVSLRGQKGALYRRFGARARHSWPN